MKRESSSSFLSVLDFQVTLLDSRDQHTATPMHRHRILGKLRSLAFAVFNTSIWGGGGGGGWLL